jgi:hypothetical protein
MLNNSTTGKLWFFGCVIPILGLKSGMNSTTSALTVSKRIRYKIFSGLRFSIPRLAVMRLIFQHKIIGPEIHIVFYALITGLEKHT